MNTKVGDLIKDQKLVVLSPEQSVHDALSLFSQRGIISAPILDKDRVLGFVDNLDLLAFLVKTSTKMLHDVNAGDSRSLMTDDIRMLNKRSKDFKIAQIGDLIDLSKRNPLFQVSTSQSLKDALPHFQQGYHRVAVHDESGKLVGVLTQGRVIREILKHWKGNKAIGDMKNRADKVVTAPTNMRTIDIFLLMHSENVSSVAILEGSRMIGSLSASDLKMLANGELPELLTLAGDYLNEIKKALNRKGDFLISANLGSSLKESIETAMNNHVHRLFILNNEERPVSVVSLTDVIKELSSETLS